MADLTLPAFPTDATALDMVWDALRQDAGWRSLGEVLDLYTRLAGSDPDAVEEQLSDDVVVLRDPQYSPHDLIGALVEEVRRLRDLKP